MTANRSARRASPGNDSPKRKPGTAVSMDLNGPRIAAGASGFGSNVSSWLTPPVMKMKIARRLGTTASDEGQAVPPDNPTMVSPPARRKSRRETPSGSVVISLASIRGSFRQAQPKHPGLLYRSPSRNKTTRVNERQDAYLSRIIASEQVGHRSGSFLDGICGSTYTQSLAFKKAGPSDEVVE